MPDLLRQEIATAARTVVVKVGTRVLTGRTGTLDRRRIARLAEELHAIVESGRQVVVVSSGAVGAGMRQLGLTSRPSDLPQLQAIAAIGQAKLIEAYDRTLRRFGRHAAQVLLTADDLDNRVRYLNVRNTIQTLFRLGAIPIVNENDTVAVDELMTSFGDNDRLAALVANLLRAPLLIILSDVDGLYDGDPAQSAARLITTVTRLDDVIWSYVRDRATGMSKGGMASKLEAARMVTAAGENAIIASGRQLGVLDRIFAGEVVGTLVVAQGKSISPRKRWIGFSAQPCGRIIVDAGAGRAIVNQGRSLLAIGIVAVEGTFGKGDVVSICVAPRRELARGLTNYPAEDIRKIQGLKSNRIVQVLGHQRYDEVVHRDNMTVVADGGRRD